MQVDISLLKSQKEFVQTKALFPAICGGLGSGKTRAATIRLILLMLSEKGVNTLIGMPTYDLLRLRAMPGVEEDLAQIGIDYKVNKSEYNIELLGFGFIYFRSYDRPERWVAFEVAHTILDELDTLPKEKAELVWRKATERTRQHTKFKNTIGNVTTPDHGVTGFTYEKWVKKNKPGYSIIYADTRDNFYLPDGYVDQIMANYDPILADAYISGHFVSFNQSKVYHFFDRNKHHSDRVIKDNDILHIGLDFNVGGCCATVSVIENNAPVGVDEFVSYDTRDFVNNLSRYKKHTINIYPDASGRAGRTNASESDISIIKNAGFMVYCNSTNPAIRDRINAYNGLIAHDRFTINTDKCPNWTNALETQGYDDRGDPEKWSDHPSIDDWADASGYFIAYKWPVIKPVTTTRILGI